MKVTTLFRCSGTPHLRVGGNFQGPLEGRPSVVGEGLYLGLVKFLKGKTGWWSIYVDSFARVTWGEPLRLDTADWTQGSESQYLFNENKFGHLNPHETMRPCLSVFDKR